MDACIAMIFETVWEHINSNTISVMIKLHAIAIAIYTDSGKNVASYSNIVQYNTLYGACVGGNWFKEPSSVQL